MNRKNVLIIISILAFVMVVGGISYSYFVYNKDVGEVSLSTGDISIDFSNTNGNQTLTNVVPLSDYEGKNSSNYFDFTVNSTVDTERIYYEVYILPDNGNTLDTSYLKTYLTDQSNNEIKGITIYNDLGNSEIENGKVIYKGVIEVNNNGTTRTETKNFRLRLWLDESYSELTSKTFDFDIYLYAKNVDSEYTLPLGANLLRKGIENKESAGGSCSTITWTDTEDDITYLSGDNTCIDMNYVWYSGKLWRINAIYPDGSMKMVTQNSITSIASNSQTNFNSSTIKKWLNEEFYPILYNPDSIIDVSKQWNATQTSNASDRPSDTTLVSSNVGLINAYEYYNSLRCIGSNDCTASMNNSSFLNIEYNLTLLNPYDSSKVWYISQNGINSGNSTGARGIRPAIYVKNNVELAGEGTISNPYVIIGDKSIGHANEKINTRLSGEYVKLKNGNNEQVFRIVDIEDNKTKIVAMDYAFDGALYKYCDSGGSAIWGIPCTGLYTALTEPNTGYYDLLVSKYGDLFDSGIYYYGLSSGYYLDSVCANSTSGNTKVCDKTPDQGVFNIGLLRYGEMFATQQGPRSSNKSLWLLNRYYTFYVWFVGTSSSCSVSKSNNLTMDNAVRPTLHLKPTVKILSGSGTESDPYVVGL